jgi:energy-coupling factor transporter ATP-binding protein EcfA2
VLDEPILFHYTDHTTTHSDRVFGYLQHLVYENLNFAPADLRLNDLELVALSASAYLHDIGMQVPIFEQKKLEGCYFDFELAEKVRKKHAECSGLMIAKSIGPSRADFPTLGLDQDQILEDLTPIIKKICEHHSGELPNLNEAESLYSKNIRIGLLTAILRLADALDLHQQRARLEKLKRFQIPLESQVHWWRHYYVQGVTVERGVISIHMCFPSDFSAVYEDYFKTRVLREINRELSPTQTVLFDNWVRVHLNDKVKVSYDESYTRRALPSALTGYIDQELAQKKEPVETIRERLKNVIPVQSSKSDWMSFWSFKGNPWSDGPLYYRDAEFVLTENIKQILAEMAGLKDGKRGELRLLIGGRGSGKTTFFNATGEALEGMGTRIRYVDVLDGLTAPRHASEIYNYVMRRVFDCLNIDSAVQYSDKTFRELIRNYHLEKTVIGIDNLDQFDEIKDLPVIQQFFRMSQSAIQEIKSKCILVISCSPKWSEILKAMDLSYLGFKAAWQLKEFTKEDIAALLGKRLAFSSLELGGVISQDALSLLALMTEGNPRRVVQTAEEWSKLAAARRVRPISKAFLEKEMVYEILGRSRTLIDQIVRQSKTLSEAVSRVYLFVQDMDRMKLSADRGWTYFSKIVGGGLPVDQVDGPHESSLAYVASKYSQKIADSDTFKITWLPRPVVREFFDQWKKSNLSFADFMTVYRAEPFVPHDFDLDAVKIVDVSRLAVEAREPFAEAKEKYEALLKTKSPPLKAIEDSWDVVLLLMESL